MKRSDLTAEYVRSVLDYDPETGAFTWRARPREDFKTHGAFRSWNTKFAGKIAGCRDSDGYWKIAIYRRPYKAHRLAWLIQSGEWPKDEIDHRDCNKRNNMFSNLRPATVAENSWNVGAQSNNTSGFKGVIWRRDVLKWQACIAVNGKQRSIGFFHNIEDAAAAYAKAAKELHGEFARVA